VNRKHTPLTYFPIFGSIFTMSAQAAIVDTADQSSSFCEAKTASSKTASMRFLSTTAYTSIK
jgi:hypothetical protein